MMYKCKACNYIFEDVAAAFIREGSDSYPYGDQIVYRDYGKDACPQCLNDDLDEDFGPDPDDPEEDF